MFLLRRFSVGVLPRSPGF